MAHIFTILHCLIVTTDNHKALQEDFMRLEKWESEWGMNFHPNKCGVLSITKSHKTSQHTYVLQSSTLELHFKLT